MSNEPTAEFWKKCSVCKKPIGFNEPYYVCSVSTCSGNRTGYVFCRMQCFETHLPGARHRDAGAIEKMSPATAEPSAAGGERSPARLIVRPGTAAVPTPSSTAAIPREVLVVASRMKDYIQARADMNTSASVMDVLSDHLRRIADLAIEHARTDGRKTVMDRDLAFLKNLKDSGS